MQLDKVTAYTLPDRGDVAIRLSARHAHALGQWMWRTISSQNLAVDQLPVECAAALMNLAERLGAPFPDQEGPGRMND